MFDYYTALGFSNLKSEAWEAGDQRDRFHLQRLTFKKGALQKQGVEENGEEA